MGRAGKILVAAVLATLTTSTAAALAGPPTATTGAASDVGATTATLTASVFPNKEATTYYFEYGTTPAYGTRTPDAGPVGGNAGKSVSADLTGLSPSTTYHARVVASNASGTVQGADVTFTTTAAVTGAPGVTLAADKAAVTFGNPVTLTGAVTGNGAGGARVALAQQLYPFSTPFADVGEVTADGAGAFSFTATPAIATRYRVEAKSSPPVTSAEVTVGVRVRVGLKVSDKTPRRGQRVRFSGLVTPAHDGTVVKLQRRTREGWKTRRTPTLKAATPLDGVARSKYSTRLRVRSTGRYRAVVVPTDGDHLRGVSPRKRLRVG
ncbi:MAG TPA: fibronectin type III domain-containing protein [Solirubrobacteraceae bacterium]|nr:fibronectin type III domain-containing protein [Solirubrobacteraceae bacterium]